MLSTLLGPEATGRGVRLKVGGWSFLRGRVVAGWGSGPGLSVSERARVIGLWVYLPACLVVVPAGCLVGSSVA